MTTLNGQTPDIAQENIAALRALFPEICCEDKVDFDKLKQVLGDYVDDSKERYNFTWNGKGRALRLAQTPSMGTLRSCPEESKNWDDTENLYLEGDNLEVLKLLQKSYHGKIKMIYIDPPYNTGGDFVYPDDFSDNIENYKKITGQVDSEGKRLGTNAETSGRYHTDWLNMMYPRLRLARNLLTDDGVIFISIDDNEVDNLKKICNEVFGEEDFVAQIVWQKAFSPKNDATFFSSEHEYILIFAKVLSKFVLRGLPRGEKQNARFKNPDNDPRGVWASSDLLRMEHRDNGVYGIKGPTGTVFYPEPGTSWRHPEPEMLEFIKNNEIYFGENGSSKPRRKRFLKDVKQDVTPQTIWKHEEVGHTQFAAQALKNLFSGKKPFDFPKPTQLLCRAMRLVTNNDSNDIVLDFFSGSATTAHAVMQLNAEDGGNRKFICVQLPEPCDESSEAAKAGY